MEPILYFIKRLRQYAGKKLYINLAGMVFVSLLEGIGILLLIPMLKAGGVADFGTGATPLSGLFDAIPGEAVLPLILALFLVIMLSQSLLKRVVALQNIKINQGFDLYLKTETYRGILQSNWAFFLKKRKSDMVSALTSEIGRVNGGINLSLQLLASVIFTVIQIALAFWLSPSITACILVCGLAITYAAKKFVGRAKSLGAKSTESARAYLAGITDQLSGAKDIKTNGLEASRLSWMIGASLKIHREQVEFVRLKSSTQFYFQAVSAALIALFIYMSVQLFHTKMEQLLLIIVVFTRLWPRFSGLQGNIEQIASFYPAFKSLDRLQEECAAAAELRIAEDGRDTIAPIAIHSSLECRGVSFRYDQGDERFALRDIDLVVPACKMTAIVGRSGAGKSTLIDMLMGLIVPERGMLALDGKPLSSGDLLSLRKSIGYVPQDPFLFNDTIRGNMTLVKPDATEPELWEALDFAAAGEFVRGLPDGLDTQIGDRGIRLSGGERQRIVLARAILRKPSVLVLDEATSALDTDNEIKIQEALERLKGRMTLLVIAHRLSTIKGADQVVVVDEGRIIQRGQFGELAGERKSLFRHLLENQAFDWQSAGNA